MFKSLEMLFKDGSSFSPAKLDWSECLQLSLELDSELPGNQREGKTQEPMNK